MSLYHCDSVLSEHCCAVNSYVSHCGVFFLGFVLFGFCFSGPLILIAFIFALFCNHFLGAVHFWPYVIIRVFGVFQLHPLQVEHVGREHEHDFLLVFLENARK